MRGELQDDAKMALSAIGSETRAPVIIEVPNVMCLP